MAVFTFELAAPPNQPQAAGTRATNIGGASVLPTPVLIYALAASPLKPDSAATQVTNLGQANVFNKPVLTVSLLIRPQDSGHGYAY